MKRIIMSTFLACVSLIGLAAFGVLKGNILGGSEARYPVTTAMSEFHSLSATTLDGDVFDFEQLKGKRVMIVNTASRCGYTPQYKKLQALHEQHGGGNLSFWGSLAISLVVKSQEVPVKSGTFAPKTMASPFK